VTVALDRALPTLTVRAVQSTAVTVPVRFALGTSAATVREAPLLLIDLLTEEGVTGRSYLFCYRPSGSVAIAAVLHEAVGLIAGDRLAPVTIAAKLERRFALIGVTGVVRMALSALDMALWDALAVAAGLPLATMLGAAPRPLPAYNSCGLGLMAPQAAADEAELLLEGGFRAVKLRLGHATLAEDLAVTRAVRRRLADHIAIMVDYNQALTVAEALGSPGGCRRRAWRRRAASKCRPICCRRRAPTCSQRLRPPIGSNTWTGRMRSWPNRWRSLTAARLPRHRPAPVSPGTTMRSRAIAQNRAS